MFLSRNRNTREHLRELGKAVETLAYNMACVPTAFFILLPNFHLCFCNSIETQKIYFLFLQTVTTTFTVRKSGTNGTVKVVQQNEILSFSCVIVIFGKIHYCQRASIPEARRGRDLK